MPKYKLTYFDFDGGRAEPVRIAFRAAGIDFEDERLSFAEFGAMRRTTRFNSLPVLEIDGAVVTQTNAMCRYVGRMAGMYPEDDLQALYCDEVLGVLEDLLHHLVATFGLEGEELRLAREQFVENWLSFCLRGLDELLARGGGEYFAGNALTVADLKAFVQTRSIRSGTLDHVSPEIVEQLAPALVEHQKRVAADPRVVAYYSSR